MELLYFSCKCKHHIICCLLAYAAPKIIAFPYCLKTHCFYVKHQLSELLNSVLFFGTICFLLLRLL